MSCNREMGFILINVLEFRVRKPCSKVVVTYQMCSECRQKERYRGLHAWWVDKMMGKFVS